MPRLALFAVAIAALGVAIALVFLAFRSGKNNDEAKASDTTATTVVVGPTGDFKLCTECHKDLDAIFKEGRVPGLAPYRHEKHFAKGVSDCTMCHSAITHAPDKINKPTMTRCFMCHGLTKTAIAPGKCTTCHPADFPTLPTSHQSPTWKTRAEHGATALGDPLLCASCHEKAKCTSCHGEGIDMPHATDWKGDKHTEAFFKLGNATCNNCHPRAPQAVDFCDKCHHPQDPKDVPWRQAHPAVVKSEGGMSCFKCHQPATCEACHVRGVEDFSADRSNLSDGESGAAAGG